MDGLITLSVVLNLAAANRSKPIFDRNSFISSKPPSDDRFPLPKSILILLLISSLISVKHITRLLSGVMVCGDYIIPDLGFFLLNLHLFGERKKSRNPLLLKGLRDMIYMLVNNSGRNVGFGDVGFCQLSGCYHQRSLLYFLCFKTSLFPDWKYEKNALFKYPKNKRDT